VIDEPADPGNRVNRAPREKSTDPAGERSMRGVSVIGHHGHDQHQEQTDDAKWVLEFD